MSYNNKKVNVQQLLKANYNYSPYRFLISYRIMFSIFLKLKDIYSFVINWFARKNITYFKRIAEDKEIEVLLNEILFKNIESYIYNTLTNLILTEEHLSVIVKLNTILRPDVAKEDITKLHKEEKLLKYFMYNSKIINFVVGIEKKFNIDLLKYSVKTLSNTTVEDFIGLAYFTALKK